MFGTKALPIFLLTSMVALSAAISQQTPRPARPAYDGSASPSALKQIHVDEDCHILPDVMHIVPGKKPHPQTDSTICPLEGRAASEHVEEKIVGNRMLRNRVNISEQEFVLQNVMADPVIFVVQVSVPKDWAIDSDPQPANFDSATALFPVRVESGKIERLHVGMRHTSPMRPKTIKTNPSAPSDINGN